MYDVVKEKFKCLFDLSCYVSLFSKGMNCIIIFTIGFMVANGTKKLNRIVLSYHLVSFDLEKNNDKLV